MKTYPKVDWKPIDKYSRAKMDKYEQIVSKYLKMEKCWEWYAYTTDVLAYNIAYLLLEV
jgi:hypothetical protein